MTAVKIEDYRDCIWNLQLLKVVFVVSLCTLDTHSHQKKTLKPNISLFSGFKTLVCLWIL